MLLYTVSSIRDELGFDDMLDINEAISAAITAAEPMLAARIGSDFDQVSVTDTFFVPEATTQVGTSFQTEFRLSRGFVAALSSVTMAVDFNALGTSDALDLTTTALSDAASLEKGLIRDFKTPYQNAYVQISYTAGFPVDATDPNSYDMTVVPKWLSQAARLRALIQLNGSPALEQAQIKLDTRTLSAELHTLVGRRVRYMPLGLNPM